MHYTNTPNQSHSCRADQKTSALIGSNFALKAALAKPLRRNACWRRRTSSLPTVQAFHTALACQERIRVGTPLPTTSAPHEYRPFGQTLDILRTARSWPNRRQGDGQQVKIPDRQSIRN